MAVILRLRGAEQSTDLEDSELIKFLNNELSRTLGHHALKGNLFLHGLKDPDYVTFSFRDEHERIVPGTPAFNDNLQWDMETLLNWTEQELSARTDAPELEPFYWFLDAVKMGLAATQDCNQ